MSPTSRYILVVTDDNAVMQWLKAAKISDNYQPQVVSQGELTIARAQEYYPDLILLDTAISDSSYLEICQQLREKAIHSIIIGLVEPDSGEYESVYQLQDCVAILNAGAHDCLEKFSPIQELQAKIRVYLRWLIAHPPHQLQFNDLLLDLLTKEVYRDGYQLELTAREFQLLAYFMQHPRHVITREQILEQVWEYQFAPNVVDVYIHYLRNKLERYNPKRLIHTVHRVGYILR
jgi:DNA-binding response OmpR family regulator